MEWFGEDGMVNFYYMWKGNKKVGEGKMQIIELQFFGMVVIEFDFGLCGLVIVYFIVERFGSKLCVIWCFELDMGNVFCCGVMIRFMKNFVGKDFEKGFVKLKNKLE